jgi:hypothetical protein
MKLNWNKPAALFTIMVAALVIVFAFACKDNTANQVRTSEPTAPPMPPQIAPTDEVTMVIDWQVIRQLGDNETPETILTTAVDRGLNSTSVQKFMEEMQVSKDLSNQNTVTLTDQGDTTIVLSYKDLQVDKPSDGKCVGQGTCHFRCGKSHYIIRDIPQGCTCMQGGIACDNGCPSYLIRCAPRQSTPDSSRVLPYKGQ